MILLLLLLLWNVVFLTKPHQQNIAYHDPRPKINQHLLCSTHHFLSKMPDARVDHAAYETTNRFQTIWCKPHANNVQGLDPGTPRSSLVALRVSMKLESKAFRNLGIIRQVSQNMP